jgi:carbon monoxide dehydrogenase subunit G
MLLEIKKSVELDQPVEQMWQIVRDPATVAGTIDNIRDFQPIDGEQRFSATVHDKLGPFKVEVPVVIDVTEDPAAHKMTARIAGNDKRGQARVRGEVTAVVVATATGSRLELESSIEVLGRLAALGAVPMRRRADQIFEVFVRNLSALLGRSTDAAGA